VEGWVKCILPLCEPCLSWDDASANHSEEDEFPTTTRSVLDIDPLVRHRSSYSESARKKTRYSLDTNHKCEYYATVQIDIHSDFHFELRFLAICYRPSVCLSVTFVRPTQAVQIFGNISTALGTLATNWHSLKISQRSYQGNPSARGVKYKRGSQV